MNRKDMELLIVRAEDVGAGIGWGIKSAVVGTVVGTAVVAGTSVVATSLFPAVTTGSVAIGTGVAVRCLYQTWKDPERKIEASVGVKVWRRMHPGDDPGWEPT
jgi:hypothetical protein